MIVTHIAQVAGSVGDGVSRGIFDARGRRRCSRASAMMMAIRYGIARGVYANEAGYGTAAVAYGTAKSQRPEQQGLAAMMDVFIISFITSSISALVDPAYRRVEIRARQGRRRWPQAFNAAMPSYGGWMVAISVFLFGYTVLIGWEFYGEQFLEYLFGPRVIVPFRWVYCLLIPLGARGRR